MSAADSGVLDLQAAHRAGLQLAAAHRIERQLCAGNGAAGKLPGRDHAALQCVGHSAQRDGCVFLGQAVVGVLRHAHGDFHTDATRHHAHAVAEKDVGECSALLIFLGIRAIHEIHLQRDRGQVAALGVFILRGLAHFGIALRLAFRLVAVRDLLCFRYRQMNPFRMGIGIQIRAVDVELRQVENVPVRVLTGGHDAGDHVGFVHVVGNAGQVLLLPDGNVGVVAHAPDQKHIVPVTSQFRAVLAHQPVFAQHGLHRIDVFPFHVFGSAGKVGIEAEIMA